MQHFSNISKITPDKKQVARDTFTFEADANVNNSLILQHVPNSSEGRGSHLNNKLFIIHK